jgi:hypothetical protein
LETHRLIPHPDTPPERVTGVRVELRIEAGDDMLLTYVVDGVEAVRVPPPLMPRRTDGLWQTTCFELFLKPEAGTSYFEYNFSPSSEWAAYRFERYREGRTNLHQPVDPFLGRGEEGSPELLEVDFDLSGVPNVPTRMGLSAVIEELSGRKSYWALAHPSGQPDFHHQACFKLELPAARPA